MPVPLPDRAMLDAAHKRAEEQRAFWVAHRAELTERFPDEFVAIQNGKVLDHDPDLMVLALRLQRAGIRADKRTIAYMASEPEYYLL